MNDRMRAIGILKEAREILALRLQERVLDQSEEILADARGDSYPLACEACESENLDVSYPESLCSACSHRVYC